MAGISKRKRASRQTGKQFGGRPRRVRDVVEKLDEIQLQGKGKNSISDSNDNMNFE